MYPLILLLCAVPLSAHITDELLYTSSAASHDAEIQQVLAALPEGLALRTELMNRKQDVRGIWDVEKEIRGRDKRIITVLFSRGAGEYETRRHEIRLKRPWSVRLARLFKRKPRRSGFDLLY